MGRKSRAKRERKQVESRESRLFRAALAAEIASDPLQGLGFDPAAVDWDTLTRISQCTGAVTIDRSRKGAEVLDEIGHPSDKLPFLEPVGNPATHEEFDRQVCTAGDGARLEAHSGYPHLRGSGARHGPRGFAGHPDALRIHDPLERDGGDHPMSTDAELQARNPWSRINPGGCGKVAYPTRELATAAIKNIQARDRSQGRQAPRLAAYPCALCPGLYHLKRVKKGGR
jgi:hypothetical protein